MSRFCFSNWMWKSYCCNRNRMVGI